MKVLTNTLNVSSFKTLPLPRPYLSESMSSLIQEFQTLWDFSLIYSPALMNQKISSIVSLKSLSSYLTVPNLNVSLFSKYIEFLQTIPHLQSYFSFFSMLPSSSSPLTHKLPENTSTGINLFTSLHYLKNFSSSYNYRVG